MMTTIIPFQSSDDGVNVSLGSIINLSIFYHKAIL